MRIIAASLMLLASHLVFGGVWGSMPVRPEGHSTGPLLATGRKLDVAILGPGYFRIEAPSGTVGYTRVGAFHLDREGLLCSQDGYKVVPEITIPFGVKSLEIGNDGVVMVKFDGDKELTTLGQIQLVRFPDSSRLQLIRNDIYAQTAESGRPIDFNPGTFEWVEIRSGFLEQIHGNSKPKGGKR